MIGTRAATHHRGESADGTDITTVGPSINASPTPGSAGQGNFLAITSGGQISLNGNVLGGSSVVELYYTNHTAYQKNSALSWFGPITSAGTGTAVGSPKGAPSQAAAAGFNTLVFSDDFATTSTIAPDTSTSSGYKWYPYTSVTTSEYSVATTATAASNNAGNGGANASAGGGILSVKQAGTAGNGNSCLTTVSTATYAAGTSGNAATYGGLGNGFWKHFYVEAYIRIANASVGSNNGWPSFWSAGVDWWHNSTHSEMDFMENFTPNTYVVTMHQWPANAEVVMVNNAAIDNNWHTYGFLWKSTGSGTGQLQFYLDNVAVGSALNCGTGQTFSSTESDIGQELQLGCGSNTTMYVDWVRLWQ